MLLFVESIISIKIWRYLGIRLLPLLDTKNQFTVNYHNLELISISNKVMQNTWSGTYLLMWNYHFGLKYSNLMESNWIAIGTSINSRTNICSHMYQLMVIEIIAEMRHIYVPPYHLYQYYPLRYAWDNDSVCVRIMQGLTKTNKKLSIYVYIVQWYNQIMMKPGEQQVNLFLFYRKNLQCFLHRVCNSSISCECICSFFFL